MRIVCHLVRLRASGVALLVVEQDVSGVMEIADIAHLMVDGSIALSGKGRDLLRDKELASRYLGVDAAILFSDLLLPLEPMGIRFDFVRGEVRHIPLDRPTPA